MYALVQILRKNQVMSVATSFTFSDYITVIEKHTYSINIFSGVHFSGFHLRNETVSLSNIESESQACHVASTDDAISMDVFRTLKTQGIITTVPSACDGNAVFSMVSINL